jgi:hypothetical protein
VGAFCETAARDEGRFPVASLGYIPRDATRTVLHQVVREHLETFLATNFERYVDRSDEKARAVVACASSEHRPRVAD